MRDRNNKGNANDREWTTMKKIFSLFLICMLAFSTLSNMIVSAESKSTGTLTIHKFEQSKDSKTTTEGNGKEGQTVPEDAKPLEGVTFEIKRIESFEKFQMMELL